MNLFANPIPRITSILLALGVSNVSAAGINLSWNDCGRAGAQNQAFDCASNSSAPFSIVASYVAPPGLSEFVGLSSELHIFTDQALLPDWWKHGAGECRGSGGLATNFDFTSGPFTCADFYGGQAQGGFAFDVGYGAPNRARLRIQCAVPYDSRGQVEAGSEYYAYKVNLLRAKSAGPGSCEGCANSACVVLDNIQLFQPTEFGNDPLIANPESRNFVTWQQPVNGPSGCGSSDTSHGVTWGRLKTLYR